MGDIRGVIRAEVGDPNGVHPLWTDAVLLDLIVMANHHFSHATGCLTVSVDVAISQGVSLYNLGATTVLGEAEINTVESAKISLTSTQSWPLRYAEPYSVSGWALTQRPRWWSILWIKGFPWLLLMPTPDQGYTVILTGTRIASDQSLSTAYTSLPDAIAYHPRHRVIQRMYQMTGDIGRARDARERYQKVVRTTRKDYARGIRGAA